MILLVIAALSVAVVQCQFAGVGDFFRSFTFFPTSTPAPAPPTLPPLPSQARWISVASYGTQVRQVNRVAYDTKQRDSSFGRVDLPWTNVRSALH
jgi:hypothetical protein